MQVNTNNGSGSGLPVAVAGGTVDAITATFSPALTLADKTLCSLVVSGANTSTTPTFSPDGLTAHVVTKLGGQALVAGDIPAALSVIILEYNLANTRWELVSATNPHTGTTAGTLAAGNDNRFFRNRLNDFRLSLVSSVAVPTSDATYAGAQTIYCIPSCGNSISLYDGSNWITHTSAEFSLALGALTNAVGYDVFCYSNAGVPTLEFLAWTSDTVRATALVYQEGILCKSGVLTRRYMGSFYNPGNKSATATMTIASPCVVTWSAHGLPLNAPVVFTTSGTLPTGIVAGTTYYVAGTKTANTFNVAATPGGTVIVTSDSQSGVHTCTVPTYTEDSNSNRLLFNYYNQFPRTMYYSYSAIAAYTAGAQIWNASLSGKLFFFLGVSNSPCTFEATCGRSNSTASIVNTIGIGVNSIAAFATDKQNQTYFQGAANANGITTSIYHNFFPVGLNYVAPLQSSTATGTCSWAANGNKFEGNIFS